MYNFALFIKYFWHPYLLYFKLKVGSANQAFLKKIKKWLKTNFYVDLC